MQLSDIKVGGTYYDYYAWEYTTVQEITSPEERHNFINVIGETATDGWVRPEGLMPEKPNAEAQVKKGAELLDQENRGWYWDVNIDALNMSYWNSCILGQLYGSYTGGLSELDMADSEAEEHGLFRDNDDYHELHELWINEINARRDGSIEVP